MLVLDVNDHRTLQATVLAMKAADRDLRKRINLATRATMNPVWQGLVNQHLSGTGILSSRLLTGVRIAAGNPPAAKAAQSRRGVGRTKRLKPITDYHLAEFGVAREAVSRPYDVAGHVRFGGQVAAHSRAGGTTRSRSGRTYYRSGGQVAASKRSAGRVSAYRVRGRHTNHGLPQLKRSGRVVFPAFAEIGPRMVSLWVQIVVRTYADAAEGK